MMHTNMARSDKDGDPYGWEAASPTMMTMPNGVGSGGSGANGEVV